MNLDQFKKMSTILGNPESTVPNIEICAKLDAAELALRELFGVIGEDAERDGLQDTPFRFVKALAEHTVGYHEDPKLHLEKTIRRRP